MLRKCRICNKEFRPHPAFEDKHYCDSACENEHKSILPTVSDAIKESYKSS